MPLVALALALAGCGKADLATFSPRELSASLHRCPPGDNRLRDVLEKRGTAALVPGDPERVIACRYWGAQEGTLPPRQRANTLAGSRSTTNRRVIARLARELNALPALDEREARSCPEFSDRSELLVFVYLGGRTARVVIRIECLIPVTNGRLPIRLGYGLRFGEHWPDEGLLR